MRTWTTVGLILVALLLVTSCGRSPEEYIESGNQFYDSGKYENAVLAYKNALQKDNQNGEAAYRLARTYLRQGEAVQAVSSFRQAISLLPGREDIRAELADVYLAVYVSDPRHSAGAYDQVRELSDKLLTLNPKSFDGLRLKGILASIDKRPKDAIKLFQQADAIKALEPSVVHPWVQALILDEDDVEAVNKARSLIAKHKNYLAIYNTLYLFLLSRERFGEAEAVLQSKVQNNPSNDTAALELANHFINMKKPTEAHAVLDRMMNAPAAYPNAPLQIGNFWAEKRNYDQALQYYELGERRADRETKVLYQKSRALIYFAQGRRGEAESLIESLLASNPDDDDSRNMLVSSRLDALRNDLLPKILEDSKKVVERHPNEPNYRFNQGRALYAVDRMDEATTAFNEVLRLEPRYLQARLYLANINQRRSQFGAAQEFAEQILTVDPDNLQAGLAKTLALIAQRSYREARTELNRLNLSHPGSEDVSLTAGVLEVVQGNYQAADKIFRDHYKPGQTDLRPLSGLIESSIALEQFDYAAQLLQTELQRSPGALPIRSALARTYQLAGRTDEALAQFRQVSAAAPQVLDFHIAIGNLLETKMDLSGAITEYQRAVQLDQSNIVAVGYLAKALAASGRTNDSVTRYREALRLQPDNPRLLNNIAYALAETGQNLDEALQYAQRAVTALPQSDGVQDTVGWVYLKQGSLDSAIRTFENIVRQQPSVSTYHYHLALALDKKGDREYSKRALENALANRPPKVEKDEILQMQARLAGR